tara:strand:+ start:404 stop:865 length:462 start_codon:yes stop_codon:yes gene_type:complete
MINVDVVCEDQLWKTKIKSPSIYFKKKLKILNKFFKFKKKKNFTILLTNNRKIKKLNRKFRNKNNATDVLSFPFFNINQLGKIKEKTLYLGDIAISYQFVNFRSKISNFKLEFDKLWIHGYLHLLGYDHKKDKDYKKMNKKENNILKLFYKTN